MSPWNSGLSFILWANGIVDMICAAFLLILPQLKVPVLGYAVFDSQGAFMAGGWGIAALAFGVGRFLASSRPACHSLMLLLGILEGVALTVFCVAYAILVRPPFAQVLLPLLVGAGFGSAYIVCAVRRKQNRSNEME